MPRTDRRRSAEGFGLKKSKMKTVIVFTSDLFSGGVAESTKKIANLLSRNEDIRVVLVVYEGLEIKKDISKNVKIERLNFPLVKEYNRGGKLFSVFRLLCLPLAILKFLYLRVKYRPHVVYSLMYIPNIVNALTSLFGGKSVVSERQNPRYDLEGAGVGFKMLLRASYLLADRVHVNSKGLGQELISDFSLKVGKIFYFPNFFSFDGLERTHRERKVRDEFVVLLIGRMAKQKGFDFLPGIVAKVPENFVFRLVTSGDTKELIKLSRRLGVDSKIDIVPERNDISELYRQSDILLVTSVWESFGNVIVEAMSHGLPVVSNKCPTGPIEILEEGRWGGITDVSLAENPESAADQLSSYMTRLSEDSDFYRNCSEKSIERAGFYSEDYVVKGLLECIFITEVRDG